MALRFDRRYVLTAVQLISPPVAIWALFTYVSPMWAAIALVMIFLMRVVGGVFTYHRYHSHQTHVLKPWVECLGTALGFYGSFTSPVEFAATHNYHHKYVDTEKDPHHYGLGWKKLFPILWVDTGDPRTVLRLRRRPIPDFFYRHFWILISLPFLLLLISAQAYFFIYFIPFTVSVWSAAISTLNHDSNGPKDMGTLFGIISGGEHMHKWHHTHPYDTSGEGWLDTVAGILGTPVYKR